MLIEKSEKYDNDDYDLYFYSHSKMIKFILLVNKQGQTRFSNYYDNTRKEERIFLEAEIVRKCLARNEKQVLDVNIYQFCFFVIFILTTFCNDLSNVVLFPSEFRVDNVSKHIQYQPPKQSILKILIMFEVH